MPRAASALLFPTLRAPKRTINLAIFTREDRENRYRRVLSAAEMISSNDAGRPESGMDSSASVKFAGKATAAPLVSSPRSVREHPRETKLLRTSDYRRVYDQGSRRQFGWTAAFLLSTGHQSGRIGITVPRKFGKAVDRNRVKRRLRSAIIECAGDIPAGWDIVLHPRTVGLTIDYGELTATLRKIFAYCIKQSSK